jgi:hypothetical protein
MTSRKVTGAIQALGLSWLPEIEAARSGNAAPLVASLRSSKPIRRDEERWWRDAIAGILAGEFRRSRGAPRGDPLDKLYKNPALHLAAEDVKRIERIWRERYHRKRPFHDEAVALAAKRRGVSEHTLVNLLKRPARDRRRKLT